MNAPPVTATLARFAAVAGDLPADVLDAGRRTFLNAVALAVGANDHPAVRRVRQTFTSLGGPQEAGLLGRGDRLPAVWAACVNGTAVHVEDFDDTHLRTIVHPGASVVPAALAAAELSGCSPQRLLEAVCVGVEVAVRVANGLCPDHFDRGWHPTGTMGHLGAAAAAGRALGLDAAQLGTALGIAGTQIAGFLAAHGTMTKALHPGKAAGNGLEAALLTARGFTGPTEVIEGRRGIGAVAGPQPDYPQMLAALGETWELEENAFKPYACGIVSHPVLDAARELHDQVPDGSSWQSLTVRANPVVLEVMGTREPADGLASKFSVYHCVAVALLGHEGGPESFSDAAAIDEGISALRRKVNVDTDPTIRRDEAHVEGVTTSGEHRAAHVQHALGSQARPLDDAALVRKATLVAAPVLGDAGADELIGRCLNLARDGESVERLVSVSCRNRAAG